VDLSGLLKTAAVKVCHPASQKDSGEAQEARTSMLKEAKIMSCYSHEHVIEFFGVACDHPPILRKFIC
jgi:hypothetical protein